MSELYKLTVNWGNGLTDEILYDAETFKSVVVERTDGGVKTIKTDEQFDITEILKIFGVPDDIKQALTDVMGADMTEGARLRYCTNPHCEKPFNWSTASRCDTCGQYLPNSDLAENLEQPTAEVNVARKMDWSNVRKALALAAASKIKPYVSRYNHSCNLEFGWDGLRPFNQKKHSFRGRSNRAILTSFDASIEVHGDKELKKNWVSERYITEGFLRFVDKYGDKLMESTLTELNPEGADMLRDEYIFEAWEWGAYVDAKTVDSVHPKNFFIHNFFTTIPRLREVVAEAAWDLYQTLLERNETKAIVRVDGAVEWRFATLEENWDADVVAEFFVSNYNVTEADAKTLVTKIVNDSDDE